MKGEIPLDRARCSILEVIMQVVSLIILKSHVVVHPGTLSCVGDANKAKDMNEAKGDEDPKVDVKIEAAMTSFTQHLYCLQWKKWRESQSPRANWSLIS